MTQIAGEPDFRIEVTEAAEFGHVYVEGALDPISLQASPARRAAFKSAVSSAVEAASTHVYLMDVGLTFEWYVDPHVRYQTHSIADLDNVLKPLIDALSGPGRLLIDDNQIQSIQAVWMDPGPVDTAFRASLDTMSPRDLQPKEGLFFIEVEPGRCWPFFERHRGELNDRHLEVLRAAIQTRNESINDGILSYVAELVMPDQRSFPTARLGKYRVERLA